jgi:hypothetical protein
VADSLKVLDLKRPIREADSICSTRVLPGVTRNRPLLRGELPAAGPQADVQNPSLPT